MLFLKHIEVDLGWPRLQDVYLMPGESVLKQGEMARELNFVTKGTLVITDAHDVLIELKTGEGTASSVVGEVSFLMGTSLQPAHGRGFWSCNMDPAVLQRVPTRCHAS